MKIAASRLAAQNAMQERQKLKLQADAPGHCMRCDGVLPGRGESGYCSFKCQREEENHK